MKTLLLMRHAHAADEAPTDFDRPLTEAGRRAADAAGDRLAAAGTPPDVILASAAARTAETARRVAAKFPAAPPVQLLQKLYGGTPGDHRAALSRCGGAAVVLLVAHNPGVADHLETLAGEPVPCPPATCAAVELDCETWDRFDERTPAKVLRIDSP